MIGVYGPTVHARRDAFRWTVGLRCPFDHRAGLDPFRCRVSARLRPLTEQLQGKGVPSGQRVAAPGHTCDRTAVLVDIGGNGVESERSAARAGLPPRRRPRPAAYRWAGLHRTYTLPRCGSAGDQTSGVQAGGRPCRYVKVSRVVRAHRLGPKVVVRRRIRPRPRAVRGCAPICRRRQRAVATALRHLARLRPRFCRAHALNP